ncbi:MAG: hypothetical protein JO016_18510 [Actinobacteria bacterium]|nr:hypothetical protein [Actinomycetota bacterium]
MQKLEDAQITLEADGCGIDDVDTDLPNIGVDQLSSFTVAATRSTDDSATLNIIEIAMTDKRCSITASDPDLATLGVINEIRKLGQSNQPKPHWVTKDGPIGTASERFAFSLFIALIFSAICIPIVHFAFDPVLKHGHGRAPISGRDVSYLGGVLIVVCVGLFALFGQARNILRTGTRAEAPTWWQEHRSDVGINIACSIVFLIIGAVIGHYWR